MKPETRNNDPLFSTLQKPYTIGSVTSADGTRIGYRQYGHGPASCSCKAAWEQLTTSISSRVL